MNFYFLGIRSEKHIKKKKTQLTEDCRVKINALCETKLELYKLQIESTKKELAMKQEEQELKISQMKEQQTQNRALHLLEIDQRKLELEITKQKLLK